MHLALYRKFRPKSFDEVIGQNHITTTLRNQVSSGEISHAYLFNGTRGTGKTSVAKVFAQSINCEHPNNGNACTKCATCIALQEPNNMDVLEIDAASNNRVDEIRELREKVKYPPVNGKYKVYIIDEVHMLTDSAFNALLKTLEEPPAHVVFILATTEVQKLPATILSRCMRFDFKLVSIPDLEQHLQNVFSKSNIAFEQEALSLIASLGEGSVRDTLSVADTVVSFSNKNVTYEAVLEAVGAIDRKVLFALGAAILKKDAKNTITAIDSILKLGKSVTQVAKDLSVYFRDLAVIKTANNYKDILSLPEGLMKQLEETAKEFDTKFVLQNLKAFSSLENEFRNTLNPRLVLEVAALSQVTDKTLELEQRIAELEEVVAKGGEITQKKKTKSLNIDSSPPEIIRVVEITSDENGYSLVGEKVDKIPSHKDSLQKSKLEGKEVEQNELVHQHFTGNENYFGDEQNKDGVFIIDEQDFVYDESENYNSDTSKFNEDGTVNKNWLHGKVLVKLREKNNLALHALVGSSLQMKIDGNKLLLLISNDVKYEVVKKEKHLAELQQIVSELGLTLVVQAELVQASAAPKKMDTESRLKEVFGNKLLIK